VNDRLKRTVYPVSLLLERKSCLVIGGGKVAVRKVAGLLDAQAAVTVVSPELNDVLAAWAASGRVRHIRRAFETRDLDVCSLVFAATDSRSVNRQILTACRERRILCCPVDANWVDGDFVTPATFRGDQVTVSVSTGGQSCRRSRLIKNSLARHVSQIDTAECVVFGSSHQQLSLREREPLQLSGERLVETGRMLANVYGVHEFMLLDTCNRTELLAIKSCRMETVPLLCRILGLDRLPRERYYIKNGFEAFEHAALLTAGLLSQMPGETHIVSQVKDALNLATGQGWSGALMAEWVAAALHISKDIRRQFPFAWRKGEIEDACISFLKDTALPDNSRMVVLGTGVVGSGLVRRLAAEGRRCDWLYHRRAPAENAVPAGCRLRPWSDLTAILNQADVVFAATSSQTPVLTPHPALALPRRAVLLLDLATPRNIDPACAGAYPQARLVDLDGLKGWYGRMTGSFEPVLQLSRAKIQEHQSMYESIINTIQGRNESE